MGERGIWLNNPPGIVPSTKIPEKVTEGALIILRAYGSYLCTLSLLPLSLSPAYMSLSFSLMGHDCVCGHAGGFIMEVMDCGESNV